MRTFLHLILLLVMGIAVGAELPTIKLAIGGGHDEFTVLMVALTLISISYFAVLAVRRSMFRITREVVVFLGVTSLLGYLFPLVAALYAAPFLPAGVMALIATLTPVVTVVVALALRTERVSGYRIAAIVLGVLATVLLLWPELELPDRGAMRWMLLMGVVPLSYGVEAIYVAAKWPPHLDAWQVGFGEAVAAIVLLAPAYLLFGDPTTLGFDWTIAETGIILFVAAGLVNIVLYFYLIQQTGAVLVSFGSFISLFAGIGWGMLIFSERHGPMVWASVVVLIGALAFVCMDTVRNARAAS